MSVLLKEELERYGPTQLTLHTHMPRDDGRYNIKRASHILNALLAIFE